jgi:ribosome-binding ATPase YchF (GTP1/OBG family)
MPRLHLSSYSACSQRATAVGGLILLWCLLWLQGKNYVVLDGDIIFFKFNVTSSGKK